ELARSHQADGEEFFVYDVEVKLLGGQSAAYSIVALQPVSEYTATLNGLREKLYLGFGAALLALMVLPQEATANLIRLKKMGASGD
ncbi:hypothetical protein SB759_36375, partial [Pseudomonas sp. SIMBA_059]